MLDDSSYIEKSFEMIDNVFENYYKNTTNFNKIYSNNNENNIPKRNIKSKSKKSTFIANKNTLLKKFFIINKLLK